MRTSREFSSGIVLEKSNVLCLIGVISSGIVRVTLAGEWRSSRLGAESYTSFQVDQILWRSLPARSLAPMKLKMRMSVGLRVSE